MIHSSKGNLAEAVIENLLLQRGYAVRNLNATQRNTPVVDLEVEGSGSPFHVSVKSCWTANRQLRLGSPQSLSRLPDTAFVMALLPPRKGEALNLTGDEAQETGAFTLWIIPGAVARDEALAAHHHYAAHHPGSAQHSVMVKDKVDRTAATRSGAVFSRWADCFDSAWHLLPAPYTAGA